LLTLEFKNKNWFPQKYPISDNEMLYGPLNVFADPKVICSDLILGQGSLSLLNNAILS
jgi:hypothetical protein